MAAYAVTVTSNIPRAMKFLQFLGLGILFGKADITNYNQTGAEVTAITKFFNGGAPLVVCSGVSSGAVKQLVRWDNTEKCFHCWVPTTGAETANDVAVGEVNFIAVGRV